MFLNVKLRLAESLKFLILKGSIDQLNVHFNCQNLKSIIFAAQFFKLIRNLMSQIADKVKAIIIDKLGVEDAEVTPEASFANDLGADSLDTVELIMEFEKEFNISIPDDSAEKIVTVGDAISYLEENQK
jgi:acyl carrier protein